MVSTIKPGRMKLPSSALDWDGVNSSVVAYSVMHNLYRAQDPAVPSDINKTA